MRKLISLLMVFVLCAALACPALATDAYTPSMYNKGAPTIVGVPDNTGGTAIGMVKDPVNGDINYIYNDCLVITPISQAETSTQIPETAKQELLSVYEGLSNGTITLPYEKLGDTVDPDNMVVRDLFDASFICSEHAELLAKEGETLELTFDVGANAAEDIKVMACINGVWEPIKSVTNNGDGTITCVFEELCPIVFCVESDTIIPPAQTGDIAGESLVVMFALMAVSAAALVTLISRRKAV